MITDFRQKKRLFIFLTVESATSNRDILREYGEDVAGFIIDKLTMAIRIKKENIGPAPDTLIGDDTMIDGVGKQEDRIITILKVNKLLERDF